MSKQIKSKVRQKLVSEYSAVFSKETVDDRELRQAIAQCINDLCYRENYLLTDDDKLKMVSELRDELMGYGPIEGLMKDPQVTEIMINGPQRVYVERNGRKERLGVVFDDESQLRYLIHKFLVPTRKRVDELTPYTEVSLPDGSRVNIVIPPVSLNGAVVTIRKFIKEIKKIEDIVALGTLDMRMGEFLLAAIKAKANIIFAGATGAGKTTTLNVLSTYIANDERIITIEDTAELNLTQDHVVRMESRTPNIEGKGEITISELFRNSLRMRPNRIILGEIRGAECLDMLQAICSGHNGSLSVIHSNSPEDVVYRMETMILASGVPLTLEAVHRQIATGINLIVQQEQLLDGTRKVTHITQVNGMKEGRIILEDLFTYDMEDPSGGKWKATGVTPCFPLLFKKAGITLPKELFTKD